MQAPEIKLRAVVEDVVLGDRCAEVLASIVMFQTVRGYSPTIPELMAMNDFTSKAPIQRHLEMLEVLGVIDRIEGQPRSIRILKEVKLEIGHGDRLLTRQEKIFQLRRIRSHA